MNERVRVHGTETFHEVDIERPWAHVPNGHEPSAKERQKEHDSLAGALEAVVGMMNAYDTYYVLPRPDGNHVILRAREHTPEQDLVAEWKLVWDVREYADVWSDYTDHNTERWGIVPGTIRDIRCLTRIDALEEIAGQTPGYYSRLQETADMDPAMVARWKDEHPDRPFKGSCF